MRYPEFTPLYLLIAGLLSSSIGFAASGDRAEALSLAQLEERLSEIETRLGEVAHLSLRSGSGAIGYRSKSDHSEERQEWIEIQFIEARHIEEVILVPTLSRNAQSDFHADAFPQELRIWAGTDDDRQGRLVGTFDAERGGLPRIAPLAIKIESTTASWIQIEATKLSRRDFDGNFCLQLSEVMVFSGNENVALHRPVLASSEVWPKHGAWGKEYLTDGHTPFLMDAAGGEQSSAYMGSYTEPPALIIDLENAYPLSQINFHTVETSDTVPTALAGDHGMPQHIKIEGARRSDFSDAVLLLEVEQSSLNKSGPVMMWPLPNTSSRYIRITARTPNPENLLTSRPLDNNTLAEILDDSDSLNPSTLSRIGFAEIELLSKGENIAMNKPFTGLKVQDGPNRDLAALTDGSNFYGAILPMREWLSQLAERHDLEFERKEVTAELNRRYSKQKLILQRLIWLASIVGVGFFIIIFVERKLHRFQLATVKQRFAADLHDEIGANLHTINLTSQLIAKRSEQLPEEINQLTKRIQSVILRTSSAIRHVSDIQSSTELYLHLPDDLKRAAERILIDQEYDIEVNGEELLGQINPRRHSDLVLFYQECLINICRHASATQVTTSLTASPKEIKLIVTDNGIGLTDSTHNQPPPSLARRAKLLKAKITIGSLPAGGTEVTVVMRRRGRLGRALSSKV